MKNIEKSVYEYNIMQCTVSCWTLGEHGDREWVSNGGELIWLKHNIYIPGVPKQNPLDYQYTLNQKKKNEGQEEK
jgi:hypothetical protein